MKPLLDVKRIKRFDLYSDHLQTIKNLKLYKYRWNEIYKYRFLFDCNMGMYATSNLYYTVWNPGLTSSKIHKTENAARDRELM